MRLLRRLDEFGRRLEDGLLALMLATMVLLAAAQILLRNLFDSGFIWADGLLRILVLWLALLGALAASREDRHIRIDLLSRFLPPRRRDAVRIVVDAFTAAVCALVAWHAVRFVQLEYVFGSTVLDGFPAWIAQIILPMGFGLMAYRYLVHMLTRIRRLLGGSPG